MFLKGKKKHISETLFLIVTVGCKLKLASFTNPAASAELVSVSSGIFPIEIKGSHIKL